MLMDGPFSVLLALPRIAAGVHWLQCLGLEALGQIVCAMPVRYLADVKPFPFSPTALTTK